jgi:hypothetical protein
MPRFKLVNGQRIQLTAEEEALRDAEEAAWAAGAFDRAITELRNQRNRLLSQSDWVVLPDSPIADKSLWNTYRQSLRDMTEGLTTVEDVNNVVWPTKP